MRHSCRLTSWASVLVGVSVLVACSDIEYPTSPEDKAANMTHGIIGEATATGNSVSVYFDDLDGFNAAAGSPPIAIGFDDIPAGTDVSGTTLAGVVFDLGNTPAPSAPLTVVPGADTYTPPGFSGVIDTTTNKLFATSGQNVLSPGGVELAPGLAPLLENDDLRLTFVTPVSAVGFDILFQSLDAASFIGITVYGPGGEVLFQEQPIPSGSGPAGAPGGHVFVGFTSVSENIAAILINEFDDDSNYPDANVGYDTFRLGETRPGVSVDIKPQSCPNPLNTRSRGVLPVAVLGTSDFDVTQVDISSILLEGTVAPIRTHIEDVATPPVNGGPCDCTTEGYDGHDDLTMKFRTQDVVSVLGLVMWGDEITLTVTGVLLDGTPIEGVDCVVIRTPGGPRDGYHGGSQGEDSLDQL